MRCMTTRCHHLCCLQAAGFTISPLMSKYVRLAGGEESQESLVSEQRLLAHRSLIASAGCDVLRNRCAVLWLPCSRQGGEPGEWKTAC